MRAYRPPKHVCGFPCHHGGLSAARKHSRAELGHMWHCNRPVKNAGDRCYQHRNTDA
ncbi:hypothetical protein SAMN04488590_3270 [Microbacterium sp. 77mftsu3.1]|nr:hypothetical protein SAMN04488590_3270 [Microbacterium sp. 77mftsu3.1]